MKDFPARAGCLSLRVDGGNTVLCDEIPSHTLPSHSPAAPDTLLRFLLLGLPVLRHFTHLVLINLPHHCRPFTLTLVIGGLSESPFGPASSEAKLRLPARIEKANLGGVNKLVMGPLF